mgnify:CR=1 FL=1
MRDDKRTRIIFGSGSVLVGLALTTAIVAATDITSMSLFRTWDISWAMTPSSSSSGSILRSPLVATTAASLGLRPVAKALGKASSVTPTSGMGHPAFSATEATIFQRRGSSAWVTSLTRFARSADDFEKKYE